MLQYLKKKAHTINPHYLQNKTLCVTIIKLYCVIVIRFKQYNFGIVWVFFSDFIESKNDKADSYSPYIFHESNGGHC